MAARRAARARPPWARSQHFLRPALAAQLVRDAGVASDEIVLDLGAGSGRLTVELARVARRVVAVELDPALAARLRGRWRNVEVVEADAERVRLPSEPFRVVANLPFHRTNALLRLLLDDPRTPLTHADLVVAWGVALKRGLPWPSTVNDVVWGAFYEAAVARHLPPNAFEPPPAEHAGVLRLRRRAQPLIAPELASAYRRFVAAGFRRGLHSVALPARDRERLAGGATLARELDAYEWAELFTTRVSRREERGRRRSGRR